VLANAKTLKNIKEEDRHQGREQFTSFRKKQFETLLAAIEMYVYQARGAYHQLLKKRVPFVSVGHDIWDSKQKEVLGVTIFFYDPICKENFRIPHGLETCSDKKADATVEQAMDLLLLAGVEPADVFKAANDTTNTALKVCRMLTVGKENGTCAMHEVQLALVHAIGAKTRTKQNKVVDSFEEAQVLHKKSIQAAGYLQNKKDKNRVLHWIEHARPDVWNLVTRLDRLWNLGIAETSCRESGHDLWIPALWS
jgi:hypothetical protein